MLPQSRSATATIPERVAKLQARAHPCRPANLRFGRRVENVARRAHLRSAEPAGRVRAAPSLGRCAARARPADFRVRPHNPGVCRASAGLVERRRAQGVVVEAVALVRVLYDQAHAIADRVRAVAEWQAASSVCTNGTLRVSSASRFASVKTSTARASSASSAGTDGTCWYGRARANGNGR